MNNNLKVSVCLITKNEEKYLEECLKSLNEIASEIIVLDTGSTDNTINIAQKYAKVFHTEWKNDFSLARNESIKYATGNWILYLDADEVLINFDKELFYSSLKKVNDEYKDKPIVIRVKLIMPQKIGNTYFMRGSLFKANSGLFFERPVHEGLVSKDKNIIVKDFPFLEIFHKGSLRNSEELLYKQQEYIKMLNSIIENNNENKKLYYYYQQLGYTYSQIKQYDKAIEYFKKGHENFNSLSLPKNNSFYGTMLCQYIIGLILNSNKFVEGIPLIDELLNLSPNFPDGLYFLGFCMQNMGNFSQSVDLYNKALNLLENKNVNSNPLGISSLGNILEFLLYLQLGRCNFIMGDDLLGMINLEKSFKINPNAIVSIIHLTKCYLLENNLPKALLYYQKLNTNSLSKYSNQEIQLIMELPPDSNKYKEIQLKILKEIENTIYFMECERATLRNKIYLLTD